MSSKVSHYLQEHLSGEVLSTDEVRRYFSTDASVFGLSPALVIYPRNESDIRKTARFTWQLAERGRVISITPRGLGSDQGGAAIGDGIIMVFPAHMNRILELDSRTGLVAVEPGVHYGKLQQTLHTHGRFLPPFPSSLEFSTVGGAVANNAAGEKSLKYGVTKDFVRELRVVLANGEVIETKRISKRELNKKMGLATFEGEVYRALDTLIEENKELLNVTLPQVSKNVAGYNIWNVKQKDGSFDLTPLLVGSQGTLGIVSEIVLSTEPHNPSTTLIAAFVDDLRVAEEIIIELRKFSHMPSAIEMIDENVLKFVDVQNPNQLKGIIEKPFKKIVLLIEFDDMNSRVQKRFVKKTEKLLKHYEVQYKTEQESDQQTKLWKLRQSASSILTHSQGNVKPLPIVEDGVVPIEQFQAYLDSVYALFAKYNMQVAVWGHAGDANFRVQPFLDLSQVGDRQKVFRFMDEYYNLVLSLGGSTTAQHNDGRLRGPYLPQVYGKDLYVVLQKIKNIFDPYNTMNRGVKIDVSLDDIKPLLRSEYTASSIYDHLPHG